VILSYEAKISTCILLVCHFLQVGTVGMGPVAAPRLMKLDGLLKNERRPNDPDSAEPTTGSVGARYL